MPYCKKETSPSSYCGQYLCSLCGKCHRCEVEAGRGTTQKAKGLEFLSRVYAHSYPEVLEILAIVRTPEDIDRLFPEVVDCGYQVTLEASASYFARPCPQTPQHGFVDSRKFEGPDALKQILRETLAADPNGEVMITPWIPSRLNAIWTPGGITIGAGHDGATSGRSTMTFPMIAAKAHPEWWWSSVYALRDAGVNYPAQWPYIEAVVSAGGNLTVTQLRAGEPLAGSGPDYIPRTTLVEQVISPAGEDLLTWQSKMIALAGSTTLVVYHPGGSMLDHYAVHARINKIPLITSFEPRVGDTLEPTTAAPPFDPAKVLDGLVYADSVSLREDAPRRAAAQLCLLGTHHALALTGENSWWVGVAAGFALRLGTIALKGEARHWNDKHPERWELYDQVANRSIASNRAALRGLINLFRYGKWNSSMGGHKWAQCGAALAPLFEAVGDLVRDPSQDTVEELIGALHVVINQAHNNGWWFNKFMDEDAFDKINRGDPEVALKAIDALWSVNGDRVARRLYADRVEATLQTWRTWAPLNLDPPELLSCEVMLGYGGQELSIHPTLRGIGTRAERISISSDELLKKIYKNLGSNLVLRSGANGYTLHAGSLPLWAEPPLTPKKPKKKAAQPAAGGVQ